MNALHLESERRAQTCTIADLLTGRLRPKLIVVTQNNGTQYEIVGAKLVHWMRRYADHTVAILEHSCGQVHYEVACDDFKLAVISLEQPKL